MCFNPRFAFGEVCTNNQIIKEFICAPRGGMRRSLTTNTLVLVTNHTLGIYSDRWEGNILHYTGMGLSGNQNINSSQNRTLKESRENGVSVYLFEVFHQGRYVFLGQVELIEGKEPYQETQKGKDGKERDVWMFPIRLKTEDATINHSILIEYEESSRRKANRMSDEVLKQKVFYCVERPVSYRNVQGKYYTRDTFATELAKRLAKGICQLCGKEAPFMDKQNNYYLEAHHIDWLSRGGSNRLSNTVALCPNCHRKMHILDKPADRNKLKNQVKKRDEKNKKNIMLKL